MRGLFVLYMDSNFPSDTRTWCRHSLNRYGQCRLGRPLWVFPQYSILLVLVILGIVQIPHFLENSIRTVDKISADIAAVILDDGLDSLVWQEEAHGCIPGKHKIKNGNDVCGHVAMVAVNRAPESGVGV